MKHKLSAVTTNTDSYSGCGTCFYMTAHRRHPGHHCMLPRRCRLDLGHNYTARNLDTRRPLVIAIVPAKPGF